LYRNTVQLERASWVYGDSLLFQPLIEDTAQLYDIFLNIEHLKSYPFENLYIRLSQNLEGIPRTDTLNLDLIGKDGFYKGRCDAEACRIEALLFPSFKFNKPGSFQIKVEQFTREPRLKGIQEVGLVIQKAKLGPGSD
jgi:gliding motility-associated lipoprotein GldH